MHKMRKKLLNPNFVAGQYHFYGSSIHLKVPTATVATSKICSMVSPMNSPSEVGPKWVCPRIRPKIQWWKTVCFPIKIAMFRYTSISGKNLINNLSVIFPIVSPSYLILHPMSFLGTQTQVYPPSHIADPHKGSPEDISTTKIHKISPSYWICLKEMYKTTHDEALWWCSWYPLITHYLTIFSSKHP